MEILAEHCLKRPPLSLLRSNTHPVRESSAAIGENLGIDQLKDATQTFVDLAAAVRKQRDAHVRFKYGELSRLKSSTSN